MHLKRVTLEQQEILLSWLEANPEIATGRYRVGHGRDGLEHQWGVVAGRLNSLGVEKDVKKWQQVWRDWKGNVKRKLQKLNQEADEPNKSGVLSTSEERILALIGSDVDNTRSQHDNFHTSSSGDSTFKAEPIESEYLDDSEGSSADEVPSCSWEIPSPAPVAVDHAYPHNGRGPGGENSLHRKTDDDPLQYKRKSAISKSFSRKRRRCSEDRYLNLEERRLKLRAQQLDLERRRLEMERARVDMSEQLAAVITRLTNIADKLEARLLEKMGTTSDTLQEDPQ